jgi:hypothetical protein
LYSSLSLITYPRDFNLSNGSERRYSNPFIQVRAPAIGGMLLKIGAYSVFPLSMRAFPSKKMD